MTKADYYNATQILRCISDLESILEYINSKSTVVIFECDNAPARSIDLEHNKQLREVLKKHYQYKLEQAKKQFEEL